ncbi:hypothetical protein [Natronohydrobacter thiooxidans]|uniref:hypothetical protein n=1 Tax=Natronohydrobacter thiooxidans TaxID=87172 RepID=UPI0008FF3E90|nr:hypothetical protein [Natronohydrobacter thiooxidans]
MAKHVIDQSKPAAPQALPRFVQIERAMRPHQSTKALVARMQKRAGDRLAAYARIARGRTT